MKLKFAFAAAVLILAGVARADSVVNINAQNITLGGETLNLSLDVDTTTNTIVPGM